MVSHAQIEPVLPVSFAGPPKSAAPLTGDSAIAEEAVGHLASIKALDLVLLNDMNVSQADIDSMTANDKQFAVKSYLDAGGTITPHVMPLPEAVENASAPVAQVHPYGTVWITTSGDVYQTPGDGTWDLLYEA